MDFRYDIRMHYEMYKIQDEFAKKNSYRLTNILLFYVIINVFNLARISIVIYVNLAYLPYYEKISK